MQIVTINVPDMFVDAIERLTDEGRYPSRSEAIRQALRDFLRDELELCQGLVNMKPPARASTPPAGPKKIDMRSIRRGWST